MSTGENAVIASVGDIARWHGRQTPERIAIAFEQRHTSFADLDRETNRVANGLLALGLPAQSRIAFLDKNTDDFFVAWLGAAKAGMVLAPINWRLAVPEIAYILEHSDAEVLMIGGEFLPLMAALGPAMGRVKLCLSLDTPAGGAAGATDFRPWLAAQADRDPGLAVAAGDIAIQLYTSGTTGRPKGAMLSHGNVLAGTAHVGTGALGPWGNDEIYLQCLPNFHIGGAGTGINALHYGATLLLLREFDPARVLETFRTWPITKAGFVPAMQLMLLQHPQCAETDFGRLDLIYYGAYRLTSTTTVSLSADRTNPVTGAVGLDPALTVASGDAILGQFRYVVA